MWKKYIARTLHLVSFAGSSSSGRHSPAWGSPDRSSKLIINNEISSASERIGAVEILIEKI